MLSVIITELLHYIKINFQIIVIPKFMMIWQLTYKNVQNTELGIDRTNNYNMPNLIEPKELFLKLTN